MTARKHKSISLTLRIAVSRGHRSMMAICLPCISPVQVYIGGELTGDYCQNGEWRVYNDIVSLAAYFRAGANGPDAFPDTDTGQVFGGTSSCNVNNW